MGHVECSSCLSMMMGDAVAVIVGLSRRRKPLRGVSTEGGWGVREDGNVLLALDADRRYELILDASCITGESATTHNKTIV